MKNYFSKYAFATIIMAAFMLISLSSDGQNYIDEDFLDKIETNAKPMLDETPAEFKINATPSKWDKKSAVIVGYSRSIFFDKKTRGGFLSKSEKSLWFYERNRLKIRLNDNNSVNEFSQIYFRYGAKDDGFIARIIKPDGTVNSIDLKAAVGVESVSDVPEYFQSFFDKVGNRQYTYYKVPVAGLEPGDILEYVTVTKSKLNVTGAGYIEFSPVYEICSKRYPIMFNEIIIETDGNSFFKYLSLNGAPQFKKVSSGDNEFYRYVFVDRDRDTEKDVNFVTPLLQYPVVKFQVIYSNSESVKGALIGEKGELKSGFTREELARKAWEDYEKMGDAWLSNDLQVQDFINQSWKELVKLGAKDMDEKKYIETAYYYLRNKVLFRDTYLSDKIYAYIFGSLLYQHDIKSELIISIGNDIGKLSQVLFDDEIRYVIKVGDKLYFNVTDFSNPGDMVQSLLDNEAYIIYEPAKKGGKQEIKTIKLPGTVAAENSTDVVIKTQLSADMKDLMVVRTSTYKGIEKEKTIREALKYTPYMFEDYRNYGGNSPTNDMKAAAAQQYNASLKELKDEFKKQKPDYVKASLESEFKQKVNNIRFDVVSDGRSKKQNNLVIKEGFELPGYVRKAGKKYLINLPGLIGSQLQVRKEERERTFDIDVRYPRTLTWTVSCAIPEGYVVKGLNEINKSVDNETGMFSIAATEEAGSVVIKITKTYKQKNISKDKWPDMLAFVDAAYNSSFKYILLTPKL